MTSNEYIFFQIPKLSSLLVHWSAHSTILVFNLSQRIEIAAAAFAVAVAAVHISRISNYCSFFAYYCSFLCSRFSLCTLTFLFLFSWNCVDVDGVLVLVWLCVHEDSSLGIFFFYFYVSHDSNCCCFFSLFLFSCRWNYECNSMWIACDTAIHVKTYMMLMCLLKSIEHAVGDTLRLIVYNQEHVILSADFFLLSFLHRIIQLLSQTSTGDCGERLHG